jgi:hypothetical protein
MVMHTFCKKLKLILFPVLLAWYLLVFFNPIPGLLIEGKTGFFNIMGLLLGLLMLVQILHIIKWKYAALFGIIILSAWAYLQFNAHWRYWIFEPSPQRIESYYNYFKDTLRLFPPSSQRIIPDIYHFILGLLIFSNLAIMISDGFLRILKSRKMPLRAARPFKRDI